MKNKKKILIINNYSMKKSLEMVDKGTLPRQHVWAIDKLKEFYDLKFLNYKCPKALVKYHLARFYYYYFQLKTILLSINCDAVYSAASPLIDWLATLKYYGLSRLKLFMIVHHPNNFSLNKKRYNKLFFISRYTYNLALKDYGDIPNLFKYSEWGPDIEFYQDKTYEDRNDRQLIKFMSIGISFREHDIMVKASRGIRCHVSIICTKKSAPVEYDASKDLNVNIITQEDRELVGGGLMSYSEMARRLSKCDVAVIPVVKGHAGICGLTSLNDAIALGKPVIISDSSHMGINVDKEGFGFTYRAGDENDLREKMQIFINNPSLVEEMGRKALEYAISNDNIHFSEVICSTITNPNL